VERAMNSKRIIQAGAEEVRDCRQAVSDMAALYALWQTKPRDMGRIGSIIQAQRGNTSVMAQVVARDEGKAA
jgi:hypothetical protein